MYHSYKYNSHLYVQIVYIILWIVQMIVKVYIQKNYEYIYDKFVRFLKIFLLYINEKLMDGNQKL